MSKKGGAPSSAAITELANAVHTSAGTHKSAARADLTKSWKVGDVKVTLELPSDLVREMKIQAVQEGRKLKDVAEQIFRRGLASPASSAKPVRRRVKLPLIKCKHAARPEDELSAEKVAALLLDQDVAAVNDAARR